MGYGHSTDSGASDFQKIIDRILEFIPQTSDILHFGGFPRVQANEALGRARRRWELACNYSNIVCKNFALRNQTFTDPATDKPVKVTSAHWKVGLRGYFGPAAKEAERAFVDAVRIWTGTEDRKYVADDIWVLERSRGGLWGASDRALQARGELYERKRRAPPSHITELIRTIQEDARRGIWNRAAAKQAVSALERQLRKEVSRRKKLRKRKHETPPWAQRLSDSELIREARLGGDYPKTQWYVERIVAMHQAGAIDTKTASRQMTKLLRRPNRRAYEEDRVKFASELCKDFVNGLKAEHRLRARHLDKRAANLLRANDCLRKHPALQSPKINGGSVSFLTREKLADMFMTRDGKARSAYDMRHELTAAIFSRLLDQPISPRQVRTIAERRE